MRMNHILGVAAIAIVAIGGIVTFVARPPAHVEVINQQAYIFPERRNVPHLELRPNGKSHSVVATCQSGTVDGRRHERYTDIYILYCRQ